MTFNVEQHNKEMERLIKQINEPLSDLRFRLIDALIIIVGLLCFLALITWAQNKDVEDAVEYQKETANRYAHMLATCTNGGAVIDRVARKAHFCGKTVEVPL